MNNGGDGGMNTGGANFDVPPTPVEQQPITTVEPEISQIQEQAPDVETEKMSIEKTSPEDLERTMSQTPERPMIPGAPAEFNVPEDEFSRSLANQDISTVPTSTNVQQRNSIEEATRVIQECGDDMYKLADSVQKIREKNSEGMFKGDS